MAAANEGKIAREALAAWEAEFVAIVTNFAKAYPSVFRRGVLAFTEPPQDAKALRQERTLLQQLAGLDPSGQEYEAALTERINATSFEETLKMLRTRLGNQGGA